MLAGLEPSISLTGGPWYTDNELDTEFIKHLMDACYKLISDIVRFMVYSTDKSIDAFFRASPNDGTEQKEHFTRYRMLLSTLLPKA